MVGRRRRRRRPFEIDARVYVYKTRGSFILRRRTVIFYYYYLFVYLFIMSPRRRALCERVRRVIGGGRKSRENRRRFRRRRGRPPRVPGIFARARFWRCSTVRKIYGFLCRVRRRRWCCCCCNRYYYNYRVKRFARVFAGTNMNNNVFVVKRVTD